MAQSAKGLQGKCEDLSCIPRRPCEKLGLAAWAVVSALGGAEARGSWGFTGQASSKVSEEHALRK